MYSYFLYQILNIGYTEIKKKKYLKNKIKYYIFVFLYQILNVGNMGTWRLNTHVHVYFNYTHLNIVSNKTRKFVIFFNFLQIKTF